MRLNRFTLRPRAFALAAVIAAPVAGLAGVACNGRLVSVGTNTPALSSIDPSVVTGSGSVGTCNAGTAHPNVCCEGGAKTSSSCGTYPGAPFQPCAADAVTFPDPRTCCDLNDPASCAPTPTGAGGAGNTCPSECAPGWFAPSDGSNECCQNLGGGSFTCTSSASASVEPTVYPPPSNGCGGDPAGYWNQTNGVWQCLKPDAAVIWDAGATSPPCDGNPYSYLVDWDGGAVCVDPDASVVATPDAGTSTTCNAACPTGWQAPSGVPGICCRDDGAGTVIECFSQVTGWPVVTGGDSGVGLFSEAGPVTDDYDAGFWYDSGASYGDGAPFDYDSGNSDYDAGNYDSGYSNYDAGSPVQPTSCQGFWPPGYDAGSNDTGSCGCQGAAGGNTYSLACDEATNSCTCTEDGQSHSLPPGAPGTTCHEFAQTPWTQCQFY